MERGKKWTSHLAALAIVALGSFGLAACSNDETTGASGGQTDAGSVMIELDLGDLELSSVDYEIAGNGFSKTGQFPVTGDTVAGQVDDIPTGTGYTLRLTGSGEGLDCSGSETFDVLANQITSVSITLNCRVEPRTGGVNVGGSVNLCPVIDFVAAAPASAELGQSVALSAVAEDPDNGPGALTYVWTASAGSLSDAGAAAPSFTCTEAGDATVELTLFDGGCETVASVLVACAGASEDDEEDPVIPAPVPGNFKPLRVGILPDTQGNGPNISKHPMRAVLDKFEAEGVQIVIPVGDITDQGTTQELSDWTTIANEYRARGMEFFPLMGNHEDSWTWTVEWIDFMKDIIPQDAYHLVGAEYLDYFVIRENVLFILLKYYHLPIAFPWIKNVVEQNRDKIDHIVIASHDGLVGAKYGETREMIVEGTAGENRLSDKWDDIRGFFSKHDVIWVQGHEHMYQRSVIRGPLAYSQETWTPADGPYRMEMYTQIMSGNASYKGYEFRYGERELVQNVIQQKMGTMSSGSTHYDANATILTFDNTRVDMKAWSTPHTINSNDEGLKELANPTWTLFDKFDRTTRRCERVVFPSSIPASTRPVMQFHPYYWTNECQAADGSVAAIVDGRNDTFNRVESTQRTLSFTPGFSRAQSQMELMRLAYQYLFQYHQHWTPNLNGNNRIVPSPTNEFQVIVPATTIDMKEHVTLSWLSRTEETLSDIAIISGLQQQNGMFASAYGVDKDIEVDMGLPGSQPDGSAKGPVVLPAGATKKWDISDAVADTYAVEFRSPAGLTSANSVLGQKTASGWVPFTNGACVVNLPYDPAYLTAPPAREAGCDGQPVVGYDSVSALWWVVLNADVEIALLAK